MKYFIHKNLYYNATIEADSTEEAEKIAQEMDSSELETLSCDTEVYVEEGY